MYAGFHGGGGGYSDFEALKPWIFVLYVEFKTACIVEYFANYERAQPLSVFTP